MTDLSRIGPRLIIASPLTHNDGAARGRDPADWRGGVKGFQGKRPLREPPEDAAVTSVFRVKPRWAHPKRPAGRGAVCGPKKSPHTR